MNKSKRCCICGKKIIGYGNNAFPIKKGTCCDVCNNKYVIPIRMKGMQGRNDSND